jgi:SAM-dependent methyltransferase
MPYYEEFDLIGAFDVLEHIKEDKIVLKNIFGALRPGGGVIITVPQHQWLWSSADVYACHVRRYSCQEIETKIKAAGFQILRSTSFVSFLLPLMFMSRIQNRIQNNKTYDPLSEFKITPITNKILESVLNAERKCIQLGLNFSMGGSRLIVAQKK